MGARTMRRVRMRLQGGRGSGQSSAARVTMRNWIEVQGHKLQPCTLVSARVRLASCAGEGRRAVRRGLHQGCVCRPRAAGIECSRWDAAQRTQNSSVVVYVLIRLAWRLTGRTGRQSRRWRLAWLAGDRCVGVATNVWRLPPAPLNRVDGLSLLRA